MTQSPHHGVPARPPETARPPEALGTAWPSSPERATYREVFLDFDPVLDGWAADGGPAAGAGTESPAPDQGRCAMHRSPMLITQPDLLALAHRLRACLRTAPYLGALERELAAASVVPAAEVPPDVVTLGSRFRFTDRRTGASETYRLVFPEEADLDRGRLSVFAPIGSAVLGRRAGETAWWDVPSGLRVVRIDDVLYQPERDGPDAEGGDRTPTPRGDGAGQTLAGRARHASAG